MNIEKLNVRLSSESDTLEFLGQIIDQFEDFLTERGITLHNPEVEEAIEAGQDPEEIAVIYGSDYYDLEDRVYFTMLNWSKREGK